MKNLTLIFLLSLVSIFTFGQSGIYPQATASGTNTYTATVSGLTALQANQRFTIRFTNANTTASTIDLDGAGPITPRSILKSSNTALSSGDIKAGEIKLLIYDGTNLQMIGGGATETVTASEGITKTGNNLTLGGTLTTPAVINGPLQLAVDGTNSEFSALSFGQSTFVADPSTGSLEMIGFDATLNTTVPVIGVTGSSAKFGVGEASTLGSYKVYIEGLSDVSDIGTLQVVDNRVSPKGLTTAATGYVTDPRSYADKEYVDANTSGLVAQSITNGVTTSAPSQDQVFDALALKSPILTFSEGLTRTVNDVEFGGTVTSNKTFTTGTTTGGVTTTFNATNATAGGTSNSYVFNGQGGSFQGATIQIFSANNVPTRPFVQFSNNAQTLKFESGDVGSTANASVVFTDGLASKKGLQYAASGYETTDLTLTSRGYVLGAKTYTGKQTFAPTATVAGLNTGSLVGNPSAPVNGDSWYNSSDNNQMFYINGGASRAAYFVGSDPVVNRIPFVGITNGGRLAAEAGFEYNSTSNTLTVDNLTLSAAGLTALRTALGLTNHVTVNSSLQNLTDQPNSEQIFGTAGFQSQRFRLLSTSYTQVRVTAYVNVTSASVNNPRLYLQYATTFGASPTWTTIGAGTTASGDVVNLATQGMVASNWITLPAGAQADVTYRVVQNGGDGAADPQVTFVGVEFR